MQLQVVICGGILFSLFTCISARECEKREALKSAKTECLHRPNITSTDILSIVKGHEARKKLATKVCGEGNKYAECLLRNVRNKCGRLKTYVVKKAIKEEVEYIQAFLKTFNIGNNEDHYSPPCTKFFDGDWETSGTRRNYMTLTTLIGIVLVFIFSNMQ